MDVRHDWLCIYESLAEIRTGKPVAVQEIVAATGDPVGPFVNFRIRALFLLIQLLKCEKSHTPFFPQAGTPAASGWR
jgi:hypothetical protein